MDKEFIETCMSKRTKEIEPSVVEISNPVVIENIATSNNTLSNYFLKGAQSILKSHTPLLAILLGYFSMEQKTYQLLAKKGLKVTSHLCGIMGLSRVIGRKDLASVLSKAYDNRLEVNYLGNVKNRQSQIGGMKQKFYYSLTLMVVFEHARKYTIIWSYIGLTSISQRLMVYFRHIKTIEADRLRAETFIDKTVIPFLD